MNTSITREQALSLLKKYNQEPFHLLHALTVEAVMRDLAHTLGFSDMEVSSLKKKFKDKKFAAGCSRDIIQQGAEMLGWTLEELFDKTLTAMKNTEQEVQQKMQTI